jgi:hypothetical protein
MPRASAASLLGSTKRPAAPADTMFSVRAYATTGRPKCMYSMTLFIVLWSDHEFRGSGSTATSADERIRHRSSSLTRPVKVHMPETPISSA